MLRLPGPEWRGYINIIVNEDNFKKTKTKQETFVMFKRQKENADFLKKKKETSVQDPIVKKKGSVKRAKKKVLQIQWFLKK